MVPLVFFLLNEMTYHYNANKQNFFMYFSKDDNIGNVEPPWMFFEDFNRTFKELENKIRKFSYRLDWEDIVSFYQGTFLSSLFSCCWGRISANQLTGFYMRATLVLNGLMWNTGFRLFLSFLQALTPFPQKFTSTLQCLNVGGGGEIIWEVEVFPQIFKTGWLK